MVKRMSIYDKYVFNFHLIYVTFSVFDCVKQNLANIVLFLNKAKSWTENANP